MNKKRKPNIPVRSRLIMLRRNDTKVAVDKRSGSMRVNIITGRPRRKIYQRIIEVDFYKRNFVTVDVCAANGKEEGGSRKVHKILKNTKIA